MEFLNACVREYKIFIDTSSLLSEGAEKFLQNILPILSQAGKSIILPKSVGLELMKLANNPAYCREKYPNNPSLNEMAIHAVKNVSRMIGANLIEIYADPDDGEFADNVFLHVLTKKRMQYDMLLITQDSGLASEALRIGKDNRAVRGVKKIFVKRIDKDGSLKNVFDSKEEIPINERFNLATEIVQIEGNLPVSYIPVEGDDVISVRNDDTKQIRLLEKLGAGGEGSVYKTNADGLVAKIYKPEKITRLRYEKLKLMLTKDIDCAGVCFPTALILNQRKEFVGYLMKAASGRDLGKSVFMPMLLKKYFPNWTKIDTVQLCVTILQKLKYLHDRNIILGDINPYNILVVSPTEVYFVDTDSWQVEGFICPVGMPLFTAPELQNKKEYGLRTLGNENFAVATLLFMIMHPGKPPYAMQDGEGIKENIINGDFSYPFRELKTGKVPKGPWRFCWSHLTYRIKEAFYQTFRHDGTNHEEGKRYDVGYWLKLFEEYLSLLESGKFSAQDEEALLIFPTRLKKDRNKTYAKCKICGKEFEESKLEEGICRDCLKDGEHYHCECCGCEMFYSNYQKYVQKLERPKICHKCARVKKCNLCGKLFDKEKLQEGLCPNCHKHTKRCKACGRIFDEKKLRQGLCISCYKKEKPWAQCTCKNCGKGFVITWREMEYYKANNLPFPTRCKDCRNNK